MEEEHMAQSYRLVGSQNPDSRVERVLVESPSDDFPDGKHLLLNGDPVELNADQVSKLSAYVRLEPVDVKKEGAPVQVVDQPGVNVPSQSTDNPPDPGTLPDLDDMNHEQLQDEARRVGADVPGNASKDSLKKAILKKREEA